MSNSETPTRRHKTTAVNIGGVWIGGGHPVVVQSMTNTDTADIEATVAQIIELASAGSELVRLTVDRDAAAAAVAPIRDRLLARSIDVPLVGDFHYIGHKLLADHPSSAEALAKYRINPGNVGFGDKKDRQFTAMIETALKYDKPVRIGANWGSLDRSLAEQLMNENARLAKPKSAAAVMREALIKSALDSAHMAQNLGMGKDRLVISCKVSEPAELIGVYRDLAARTDIALHLGLTEAGMGDSGIISSTAALAVLLEAGIGDTIRVSLTPPPGGARSHEVRVAQGILQSLGVRDFFPQVISCPGCGRTTSTRFQELAGDVQDFVARQMPEWRRRLPGVESLKLAVMGCIVNGPGESKNADMGISLPGSGESSTAPVFADGVKIATLKGDNLGEQFMVLVNEYVERRFGNPGKQREAGE